MTSARSKRRFKYLSLIFILKSVSKKLLIKIRGYLPFFTHFGQPSVFYLSAEDHILSKGGGWWKFWEGDLLYNVETFRSCSFIPRLSFVINYESTTLNVTMATNVFDIICHFLHFLTKLTILEFSLPQCKNEISCKTILPTMSLTCKTHFRLRLVLKGQNAARKWPIAK